MASEIDDAIRAAAPAILGRDASFEGVLSFRGDARVEGRLRGEVYAQGGLRVEAGASVEGRVEVDELVVAGSVRGEVIARRRVELLPTARVEASVRTDRLSLADGCILVGRCDTGAFEPNAAGAAEPRSAS